MVVGRCLQHKRSLHRADDRCYMRNHKIIADQEAHVMGVMENFGDSREVCVYAREVLTG